MAYTVLTQDEQDDVIVSYMLAQERDLYAHELNQSRFSSMLDTLPEGEFKNKISKLLSETGQRIAEVTAIITATATQMPPDERVQASRARLAAKTN